MYYYWFEILKELDEKLMITVDNSIQNSGIKFFFFILLILEVTESYCLKIIGCKKVQ